MKSKEQILKEATKKTLNINEGSPLHDAVMYAMEEYARQPKMINVSRDRFHEIFKEDRYEKREIEVEGWCSTIEHDIIDTETNEKVGYCTDSSWGDSYMVQKNLTSPSDRVAHHKRLYDDAVFEAERIEYYKRKKEEPPTHARPGLLEFLESDNMLEYNPLKNLFAKGWDDLIVTGRAEYDLKDIRKTAEEIKNNKNEPPKMTAKDKIYVAINGIERGLEENDDSKIEAWRENLNQNIDEYLYEKHSLDNLVDRLNDIWEDVWSKNTRKLNAWVHEEGGWKKLEESKTFHNHIIKTYGI